MPVFTLAPTRTQINLDMYTLAGFFYFQDGSGVTNLTGPSPKCIYSITGSPSS